MMMKKNETSFDMNLSMPGSKVSMGWVAEEKN